MKPIKLAKARQMRSRPTRSENILWQALRLNQFNGLNFRRQHVVLGYIVDFYCAQLKLVIEIDGEIHQTQIMEDMVRQKALEVVGLRVFRVASREVEVDIIAVLGKINSYLLDSKDGDNINV